MKGKEIYKAMQCCCTTQKADCEHCPFDHYYPNCFAMWQRASFAYVNRLLSEKQLAETQLKELLSALYQRTGEKGFTLYRKDIVELAKDYGIKEEELK